MLQYWVMDLADEQEGCLHEYFESQEEKTGLSPVLPTDLIVLPGSSVLMLGKTDNWRDMIERNRIPDQYVCCEMLFEVCTSHAWPKTSTLFKQDCS